jgi:hypothetical protein
MEIARVLGSMVKSGWRPRRTIVFASWAVEEFGLEGSYEYVFENINKIMSRYEYLKVHLHWVCGYNCGKLLCMCIHEFLKKVTPDKSKMKKGCNGQGYRIM